MTEYCWARPDEEDELIDFANYVFSLDGAPTDFRKLHPRVYDRPGSSAITQVAREQGKIKGLISAVTGILQIGQQQLKYGFIGTVSVHPYFRGKGYMKRLMPMTMDALKAQGCQLILLGGQRQRYQHFGFEDAGAVLTLNFSDMSLRHTLGAEHDNRYTFVPLHEAGQEALDQSIALFERKDFRSLRKREDFLIYMKTWMGKSCAIYHEGQYAGYVYLIKSKVAEYAMLDESKLPGALYALMRTQGRDHLRLGILPLEARRYQALLAATDSWEINPFLNLQVLDWAAFLGCLLAYKAGIVPLEDGQAVLGIAGQGNYHLAVKNNQVHVEKVDVEADLTLEPMAALRLTTLPFVEGLHPGHPFHNWFPLPFLFSDADAF